MSALTAHDGAIPAAAFFYVARSRNACGANAGTDSAGTPRIAGACP